MKYCMYCGSPLDDEVKFCSKCGKPQTDDTAPSPFPSYKTVDPEPMRQEDTAATSRRNPAITVLIVLTIILAIAVTATAAYLFLWKPYSEYSGERSSSHSEEEDEEDEEEEEEEEKDREDEDESDAEDSESAEAKEEVNWGGSEGGDASAEESAEAKSDIVWGGKAVKHSYTVIEGDMSWSEARKICETMYGGYLATITSQEEFDEICALAEQSGLTYLWLGAYISSDTDEWSEIGWITGEEWSFEKWYPGEPSKKDTDGTEEYYLCLWNAKYQGEDIGWTFNDQREDIVDALPSLSGKVGFVCEYAE